MKRIALAGFQLETNTFAAALAGYADFESIADLILVVEAPGSHPCRLDKISYNNLRPGVRLGPGGRPHGSQNQRKES